MSGIATGTALLIGGGLAAGGSVASGLLGSSAAKKAAETQANAAEYGEQVQGATGQEALANEVAQFEQGQENEEPWLQSGANSLATLQYLMGTGGSTAGVPGTNLPGGATTTPQSLSIPGVKGSVTIPGVTPLTGTADTALGAYGSLMASYPGGAFTAPTAAQAAATPGYQFAVQQGEGAQQASAAANGSLLTGGTQNALDQYAQNYANTNYNNVYNQALTGYNTNYNTWANQQANEYNRLAAQSGLGQQTAQQLTSAGLSSAGQVANTVGNTGSAIANEANNAAAATASGYVGGANALGSGITGATNSLSQLLMLQSLFGAQNSGGNSGPNAYPGEFQGLMNSGTVQPAVYGGTT